MVKVLKYQTDMLRDSKRGGMIQWHYNPNSEPDDFDVVTQRQKRVLTGLSCCWPLAGAGGAGL